jgi:general L-amino acid transport system substrate-binding protein
MRRWKSARAWLTGSPGPMDRRGDIVEGEPVLRLTCGASGGVRSLRFGMPRRSGVLPASVRVVCGLGLLTGWLLSTIGVHQAAAQGSGSATLDAAKGRGHVLCGVSGQVPGFSLPDSQGVMRGLDADSCRAVTTAALGDASKTKFVTTTTQNRFTALQSGEVDVLSRSTTWTLGREGNLGLEFAWVNYYDGTGFLVKKSVGVTSAKEMDGASICVQPGTSTELAINDYFRLSKMKFTPILIQDLPELQGAFLSGRCDAYSTDASALATFRFSQGPKAGDLVLLPEIISKEPLGVMVRKGDDKWFDIIRWTFIAMITAEEKGISSANVDSFLTSTDPDIRRLLGVEGEMGKALGLDNKWAYNVIKQVGNLSEVWDRNIAPMGVPRGINNIWQKGGLQYAPPIR